MIGTLKGVDDTMSLKRQWICPIGRMVLKGKRKDDWIRTQMIGMGHEYHRPLHQKQRKSELQPLLFMFTLNPNPILNNETK